MRSLIAAVVLAATISFPAYAQDIREERVQFDADRSGTTSSGRIRGDEIVDYLLGAGAEQHIAIDFQSSSPSGYFNLLPAHRETAFFVGSSDGNASVWIEMSAGRERHIQFKAGRPVGSDPGLSVSFERLGDLTLIRIGGVERYEIPDAILFGG